jgi:hypothetical protein
MSSALETSERYPRDFHIALDLEPVTIRVYSEERFSFIHAGTEYPVEYSGYACRTCGYDKGLLLSRPSEFDRCEECGGRYIGPRPLTDVEVKMTRSPQFFKIALSNIANKLKMRRQFVSKRRRDLVLTAETPKLPKFIEGEEKSP